MGRFAKSLSVVVATFCVAQMAAAPRAQMLFQKTPCGAVLGGIRPQGLTPVDGGTIVYDSNQGLCWLADANLAGNPFVRAMVNLSPINPDGLTTPVINPDGTMDYQTALNWVNALNDYNHGNGWLNHHNWQLPTAQATDTSCSSHNGGNFGALCSGSALGNLYNKGLGIAYPNSVVSAFASFVWPLVNLQPGIYWTGSSQSGGESTFSFNTGDDGANTTNYNFFHVLPMTRDVLGSVVFSGPSCSVLPYVNGPGAGKAVYDSCTGLSWPLDANLAARNDFGFVATTFLSSNIDGMQLTVPMINKDGAVFFDAIAYSTPSGRVACPTATTPCPPGTHNWIVAMNNNNYAGSQNWMLPSAGDQQTPGDLNTLFSDLGLPPGDVRLEWFGFVGPFPHLQPGFYWMCERNDTNPPNPQAPCNPALMPGQSCQTAPNCPPFEYSFNFDDGFEGTDHPSKHFSVMVYYPASFPQ
jgi:hypothetical protein